MVLFAWWSTPSASFSFGVSSSLTIERVIMESRSWERLLKRGGRKSEMGGLGPKSARVSGHDAPSTGASVRGPTHILNVKLSFEECSPCTS